MGARHAKRWGLISCLGILLCAILLPPLAELAPAPAVEDNDSLNLQIIPDAKGDNSTTQFPTFPNGTANFANGTNATVI